MSYKKLKTTYFETNMQSGLGSFNSTLIRIYIATLISKTDQAYILKKASLWSKKIIIHFSKKKIIIQRLVSFTGRLVGQSE